MNPSIISALAALAEAAIGGLTSILASWWTQHAQAKAQWLMQDNLRRQELYKEFIEEASKAHIDALQHDKTDIACAGWTLREDQQDAPLALAGGRRKRRSSRPNNCRYVSGAKQDLP
jgi:hypothetical protein